jgi:IS5 family transposase
LLFPGRSRIRSWPPSGEWKPNSAGKEAGLPTEGEVNDTQPSGRKPVRRKRDTQGWLDFQPSNLSITNEYYARYEAVSRMLDEAPRILDLFHADLEAALEEENRERKRRGEFTYTSEMVFRVCLCQVMEGASLREIVVRVDDSACLRRFTRIHSGPMLNYTTLCKLRNVVDPETWKEMNRVLARAAVEQGLITGEKLRLDTTAVETNIHWPTDSSLLWDSYRTLGRLLEKTRERSPRAVGDGRVHLKRTKKLATRIARKAQKKGRRAKDLKPLYKRLIRSVGGICDWAASVAGRLEKSVRGRRTPVHADSLEDLLEQFRHFEPLARHVVWQATERVLHEGQVANEEKLFSIFEDHTELLKRGKAGKDIEFGHMIQIQQCDEKFITDYDVFAQKPVEPTLVQPALKSHVKLFGHLPGIVAADKGYWSAEEFDELEGDVEIISIPKKGRRNEVENERELDPLFRLGQVFRAGVEGSISYLKRFLRLARCMNKGWEHYVSTIGATVLAHNLLVLARW